MTPIDELTQSAMAAALKASASVAWGVWGETDARLTDARHPHAAMDLHVHQTTTS